MLMSVAVNGAMLLKFDAVAHEGVMAGNGQTPTVVTLKSINIVTRKS